MPCSCGPDFSRKYNGPTLITDSSIMLVAKNGVAVTEDGSIAVRYSCPWDLPPSLPLHTLTFRRSVRAMRARACA